MDAPPIDQTYADSDDELQRMEERLRAAMLAGDVAELDALIDDALVFTTMTGAVATKAMDLDAHRSGISASIAWSRRSSTSSASAMPPW